MKDRFDKYGIAHSKISATLLNGIAPGGCKFCCIVRPEADKVQVWTLHSETGKLVARLLGKDTQAKMLYASIAKNLPNRGIIVFYDARRPTDATVFKSLRDAKAVVVDAPEPDKDDKPRRFLRKRDYRLDDKLEFGKYGPATEKYPHAPHWTVKECIDRKPGWISWAVKTFNGFLSTQPDPQHNNLSALQYYEQRTKR